MVVAGLTAHFALGAWIKRGVAIYYKDILMVAVSQFDAQPPTAIGHALQRVASRVPLVKVTHQMNRFGFGGVTIKIDQV
jgi:hypothetical protein